MQNLSVFFSARPEEFKTKHKSSITPDSTISDSIVGILIGMRETCVAVLPLP